MCVLLELVRRQPHEPFLNFEWRLAFRNASAVRDTKNMRIDGNRCFTEGGVEYDIGRFSTDAGQGLQFFAGARHFTVVPFDKNAAGRYDVSGFAIEKPDRAYVWPETVDAECQDGAGRSCNGKKFVGCLVNADIRGLR